MQELRGSLTWEREKLGWREGAKDLTGPGSMDWFWATVDYWVEPQDEVGLGPFFSSRDLGVNGLGPFLVLGYLETFWGNGGIRANITIPGVVLCA